MSRWVRCSYGKRAGFVGAKIQRFNQTYKLFLPFLMILKENGAIFKFLSLCLNMF